MIRLCALGLLLSLTGCASLDAEFSDTRDPYEDINRHIYAFNETLDHYMLRPLSQGYQQITPTPVNQSITHFFNNLNSLTTLLNSLLQHKPQAAGHTAVRFALNSTVGLAGLLDVATPLGWPQHQEDFAQTLGTWGMQSGPYLVLPVFGPSSIRDLAGILADWWTEPLNALPNNTPKYALRSLSLIDQRADLLPLSRVLDQALDPYSFVRDAYLQRQATAIRDGASQTPDDWDDDHLYD
jgi:phospholipid-binding lipoprotein MlaA